jgi:hypothetical protein
MSKRVRKEESSSSSSVPSDYDSEEEEDAEEEEEEEEEDGPEPDTRGDDLVVLGASWKAGGFVTIAPDDHTPRVVSPWRDAAMTVMCIFQFRNGPWKGKLSRDTRQIIAKLVYRQRPNLLNVYYCTQLDYYPYVPEKGRWDDDYEYISACHECGRPYDWIHESYSNDACWIHGKTQAIPVHVCSTIEYHISEDSSNSVHLGGFIVSDDEDIESYHASSSESESSSAATRKKHKK